VERGILTEEDIRRIEEGELNLYFYTTDYQGGPTGVSLARQAEVLFKLMPLLPRRLRPLFAGPLFEGLDRVPEALLIPLMGVVGLARRDPFLAGYLKFYLDHLGALARADLTAAIGRRRS